jgi:hypothetical protein
MADESAPKADTKKSGKTTSYRHVGLHADVLDGGMPVGSGDQVDLTDEDAQLAINKMLVDEGVLIPIE